MEQEYCIRLCRDLYRMLEEEKVAVPRFLSGDIYDAYEKLLDLEMDELTRLRRIMDSY